MSSKSLAFDGYIRISRVNGRSGESYRSPGDQREIIERLAREKGITLGEIVTEEDVSGGKKTSERELGRLVGKIEAGESGGLIVWNISRFSRNWTDGIFTVDRVIKAGGRLIADNFDSTAPYARTVLSLHLEAAEALLEEKRATWKRATDGATNRGVYVGITPAGFDRLRDGKLQQNADAPAVREVFLDRAKGRSWNDLCSDLEAAGVEPATYRYARENIEDARTAVARAGDDDKHKERLERLTETLSAGPRWHINSVRSLVGNQIYKGTLKNGIEHFFKDYAVVTLSEWDAAQPTPEVPGGRRDRGGWALLGGLVFCAECGSALTPSREVRGDKAYGYYRCTGKACKVTRARADELETFVIGQAVAAWEEEVAAGRVTVGEDASVERITELEQAVETAKARRRAAVQALDPSDPEDASVLEAARIEVETAKQALADEQGASRVTFTPADWKATWEAWTVAEKRDALGRILEGVTVSRVGYKVDPAWVAPEGSGLFSQYAQGGPLDRGGEGWIETKDIEHRVEIRYGLGLDGR